MLLVLPPKMSVSAFVGNLKGKSSLMIYEQFGDLKFKYCIVTSGALFSLSIRWAEIDESLWYDPARAT